MPPDFVAYVIATSCCLGLAVLAAVGFLWWMFRGRDRTTRELRLEEAHRFGYPHDGDEVTAAEFVDGLYADESSPEFAAWQARRGYVWNGVRWVHESERPVSYADGMRVRPEEGEQ